MAKTFQYTTKNITQMKTVGELMENGKICIEGEIKEFDTLWKDFVGKEVEVVIKFQDQDELDEPAADEDDAE